ncbi:metallophosphoesterase [Kaarinaea lacus]
MDILSTNSRKLCSLPALPLGILVACTTLFVSGCATMQEKGLSKSASMEFAVIGDMPYNGKQRKEFVNLMKDVDAEDLAFVLHAGDFWFDGIAWKETTEGLPPCSDEVFDDRLSLAQASRHPYILTPGDNDWTDCYRAKPQSYDTLERLAKLRSMFFSGNESLGQHKLKLTSQSENPEYAKFPENARWTYAGVQFVTLHMTGSNNNLGRTPEMDAEYQERNRANLAWLDETFREAKNNGSKAIMILSQANPFFENTWSGKLKGRYLLNGLGIKPPKEKQETGFDDFLLDLEELTLDFGKPVVYVHGDTHTFRIDKPLVRSPDGSRMIENFTRVETFGFPNTHWIRVRIDHNDPNVFSFRQEIVKSNVVKNL